MITIFNIRTIQAQYSLIKKRYVTNNNTVPKYQLLESLEVYLSNGDLLIIPEGFIWDLSSVPRFLWWLLPPDGDFGLAYLIHDYLYIHKHTLGYSRRFADEEMLIWARASHGTKGASIKNIDNYIRYYAVRLFGWTVWNR